MDRREGERGFVAIFCEGRLLLPLFNRDDHIFRQLPDAGFLFMKTDNSDQGIDSSLPREAKR
jgi:hypothetical protein